MAKEAGGTDAKACAVAIADLRKAKALFAAQCAPNEQQYEHLLSSQREEKPRCALLQSVFARCEQVVDRDLDIMTHRNDSVYYEPVSASCLCDNCKRIATHPPCVLVQIPDPEPASDPVGLVRAVGMPPVRANPIWTDRQIATCLRASSATPAAASPSDKPRESCCESCVIS
jgi:hypothetical protein